MNLKAAIYTKYGGPEVVDIREIPKPLPKKCEVLIRTKATTVNSADWRLRSKTFPTGFGLIAPLVFGITGPRKQILGTELSGVVEQVGDEVTEFKVGDAVFAMDDSGMGCHAEFKIIPASGTIAMKPENLSFEQAAAICFGGHTALSFLHKWGNIRPGEKVLVNGASGATGLACIQIAKHFGTTVTAVCSRENHDLVAKAGADFAVDYTKEDFTLDGNTYDIIVDTAGTAPWSRVKASLADTGRLLAILGTFFDMIRGQFLSKSKGKKLISGPAEINRQDLHFLAELCESGEFVPILDSVLPFEDIRKAHRRVDTGRKRGSVVLTFS